MPMQRSRRPQVPSRTAATALGIDVGRLKMSRDSKAEELCTVAGPRRSPAATFAARFGRAPVRGLFLVALALAGAPVVGQVCNNDQQGPDDLPGQKDLTRFCAGGPACATSGLPPSAGAQVVWQFDDTAWSGMNTGDACVLYDTDGDGNAN